MTNKEMMLKQCEIIKNPKIKNFTEIAINNLPGYFFITAASTSGKYHSAFALGEGGLVRHSIAALRFAIHFFEMEYYQNQFSEDVQDCVYSAVLLHDGWKHGNGNSIHSVHEHPQICADWIKTSELFDNVIDKKHRELIASGVATHMGAWNTSKKSKVILEKPSNKFQHLIHSCDYFASRSDIDIKFEDCEKPESLKIEDYKITFGKFKGIKLIEAFTQERDYFKWVLTQDKFPVTEPLGGYIKQLFKESKESKGGG